jgi:acyl-CoA reductase-like NAD-dependent aldehyde dehydrogenase
MSELRVVRAYDRELLASLPLQSERDALDALERAYLRYSDRDGWLPASERIRILERTAQLVEARADEIALQIAREGGKPLLDARIEVGRGIDGIRIAVRELGQLAGREIPMGLTASSLHRFAVTHREPRGVALAISAFNHPFNLIVHQAIPAIAVGCPVLVKPSLATPLSCRTLLELLYEAGLPRECCQMLLVDNAVAEKLVSDPRLSFLSFIGSARVGWHLRSKLAPGADCALEHGGVAPVLVERSADLDACIPLLVKGGYYHAGQVCVSVQRIYVEQSVAPQLIDGLVAAVERLRVGDPELASTEVGPLIAPAEVQRVHAWVQEGAQRGGRVLCGGQPLTETCYAPTVVLDPPDDVKLSCSEVFGPVVAVYPYADRLDAIRRANAPDAYFQAAVFTRDLEVALDTARRLHGMAVMVNDHTAFRVDWMPFGGHRQSGLGVGGIGYSMRDMTLERMVVFRSLLL